MDSVSEGTGEAGQVSWRGGTRRMVEIRIRREGTMEEGGEGGVEKE